MDQLPPRMRTPYVAVYRVNAPSSVETTELPGATLRMGPFSLRQTVPMVNFGDGMASMTMGIQEIPFGAGLYLLVVREHDAMDPDEHSRAALEVAETAGVIEVFFPGLIASKLFEGPVNTRNAMIFSPGGTMTITARPFEGVERLREELSQINNRLTTLPPTERDRFRLASRWFRRGCETLNPIDRLLFLYIALEVYPAAGDVDVPRYVRDLIHERVYPNIIPSVVKERIGVGPIAGLRAQVVHSGLSAVPPGEAEIFHRRLEQLDAIARVCLRLLLGEPPGSELDRWVLPDASTQTETVIEDSRR